MSLRLSKFSVFIVALMGWPSQSWAGFNGYYAGGNFGLSLANGKYSYSLNNDKEDKFRGVGASFGIQGGYLSFIEDSKAILGGELYARIPRSKATITLKNSLDADAGVGTLKSGYVLGLTAITGVALNPKVLVCARAGVEKNKFTLDLNNLTFQTPTGEKFSKSLTALAVGTGVVFKITPKLLLGLDYTYSVIPKFNAKSAFVNSDGDNTEYTINLSRHLVAIKISYLFGGGDKKPSDFNSVSSIINKEISKQSADQGGEDAENSLADENPATRKVGEFIKKSQNSR